MFEKHIDREEGRGLILYLDNKLEAPEIHMYEGDLCQAILLVSSYVDIESCPVLFQHICIHDYLCYPLWYSSSPSRYPGN
jgi:hypothetical protein